MKARRPVPKKPFALVEQGPRGLRLIACDRTARGLGLHRGQRLADARAMAPSLACEIHEPHKDAESLLGLTRWCERYSPWVSLDGVDGLLVDATGSSHLFGGEPAMAADMERRFAAYGFTARIAIAATIGAAWALARYSSSPHRGEDIGGLPIEALRIDTEAARTLRRLGLKTIGHLIDIPRSSLARRFRGETIDENVLMRLDEALGVRSEPFNPLTPPPVFLARQAMMEPLISQEGLEATLREVLGRLAQDLEAAGQGALRLMLTLYKADGGRIAIPIGLTAPSRDARHLFKLFRPKLENLDAGFGIDALVLEARETAAIAAAQQGFMEESHAVEFDRLNDRVKNRHEDRAIAGLSAVASHVPERAENSSPHFCGEREGPVAQRREGEGRSGQVLTAPHLPIAAGDGPLPLPAKARRGVNRPLLIFDVPESAIVLAAVPDGPPMRFTWRRVARRVAKAQGPERIAPEWWRLGEKDAQPRDYYTVEDDKGRRYWLYREGLYGEGEPKWFVHGLSP
jgi:protein ImuB